MNRRIGVFAASLLLASAGAVCAQRIHRSIDEGWRFLRDDAPGAYAAQYNDRTWQTVDLPHDFSITDLSPQIPGQPLRLDAQGWLLHTGDNPEWCKPGISESDWKPVEESELNSIPEESYAWMRRHFSVPPYLRGKDLDLIPGKIDDVDVTYVNGIKVGTTGSFPPSYLSAWDKMRHYTVPAKLLKGDGSDIIAIRIYNGRGGGGITPPTAYSGTISGPFNADSPGEGAQAYTIGGPAWYRKSITVPKTWRGHRVAVDIDGAYQDATIWINGVKAGSHAYGYTSYQIDATPYIKFGEQNIIAIRVDTSGHHSRWYSGSGLYRHVWLTVTEPMHFEHWGISVTTPAVNTSSATINVQAKVLNESPLTAANAVAHFIVRNAAGQVVAQQDKEINGKNKEQQLKLAISVKNPALWSPDHPNLYTLESAIVIKGKSVDTVRSQFGIRTISVDAKSGFLLNGKPFKLKGGCVHHDNGPLGSAAYDRAEERRVELLKAAGFNAIRTSHNPPSEAFLNTCDRVGMLVLDEAFDCWMHGKTPNDYARFFAANWQADLRSMVERDRNHPSIVLWSIGNEIPEQDTAEGAARAKELAGFVRSIDSTRPVTAAYSGGNNAYRDGYMQALDVAGYNYKRWDYEKDHEKFPSRVIVATESVAKEAFDFWQPVEQHSYVIGDFVWTAMDYLGEAGIGRAYYPDQPRGFFGDFPWTVAGCGDIDIIGNRKPQSYYRGVIWNAGPKVAAFVDAAPDGVPESVTTYWGWPDEHANWTWPGSEGKMRTVRVYARTPKVKLIVNGKDMGVQPTTESTRYTATYKVPYEPGELQAIGLDDQGKETEKWTLKTAGKPESIKLTADRKTLHADGQDLSYVAVELLDKDGNPCTNASDTVEFTVKGPGVLAAAGNGKPDSIESFQAPKHSAYEGRLLAIVKSSHKPGTITLAAKLPNAAPVSINIISTK